MKVINSFVDSYGFLSNFFPTPAFYDGINYPSVEHAYMAAKTLDVKERESIWLCVTPGQAKRLGQKVTLRSDWDLVKVPIMHQIVINKFMQNDKIRKELFHTGDKQLEEGNTWGDTFWGVCDGVGENHLGAILMNVREELRLI